MFIKHSSAWPPASSVIANGSTTVSFVRRLLEVYDPIRHVIADNLLKWMRFFVDSLLAGFFPIDAVRGIEKPAEIAGAPNERPSSRYVGRHAEHTHQVAVGFAEVRMSQLAKL